MLPLVLAPPPLHARWAAGQGDAGSVGAVTHTLPGAVTRAVPEADGRRGDPYRLVERLPGMVAQLAAEGRRVDRVVLVAPRRRGAAGTVPGPVLAVGERWMPVGVLPADRPEQLEAWWAAVRGRGSVEVGERTRGPVVAAMGIDRFLATTQRWLDELSAAGLEPLDRRACCTRREALAEVLATGPDLVLYLGHGHHLGWCGYQGLRWQHLPPQQQLIGTVIALACATLAQPGGQHGFGTRLVTEGRAVACLGAARPLPIADLVALGDGLVRCLVAGAIGKVAPVLTLGDLLVRLSRVATEDGAVVGELRDVPGVARAVRGLRIVGDPAAPVAELGALLGGPAGGGQPLTTRGAGGCA